MPASRPKRAPRKTTSSQPQRGAPSVPAFRIPPILLEGDPLPEPITPIIEALLDEPAAKPDAPEKVSPAVTAESAALVVESKVAPVSDVPAEMPRIAAPSLAAVAPSDVVGELPAATVSPAGFSANREPSPQPENGIAPSELPQPKASLWLSPRDPHSLLVSWEWQVPPAPSHPPVFLRLFEGQAINGEPVMTMELPGEVSHRFLTVGKGNTWFAAQIGVFQPSGRWHNFAEATPVQTPADQISPMAEVMVTQKVNAGAPPLVPPVSPEPPHFSTIEASVPVAVVVAENTTESGGQAPPMPVADQFDGQSVPQGPVPICVGENRDEPAEFTLPHSAVQPELSPREQAVEFHQPEIPAQVEPVGTPMLPHSLEVPLSAGASERRVSSLEWAKQPGPTPAVEQPAQPGITAPSSLSEAPEHAPDKGKNYWLVAEVELIVYGATEPGSRVTLAGTEVALRPDGSFSCRLALPAGRHELPIQAISPDGEDSRQAGFVISRA